MHDKSEYSVHDWWLSDSTHGVYQLFDHDGASVITYTMYKGTCWAHAQTFNDIWFDDPGTKDNIQKGYINGKLAWRDKFTKRLAFGKG